ncbi:hypothetical protein [Streptomyces noursei]|uniref:hypothetical protein n=1 Tax=Streptomyces noursei TaxID=1971 RepID=UPI0023B78F01|nr:hypothetical protein [Streptomyces noursei]
MSKSLDRTGRGAVGALAALVLSAALTSATAATPGPGESARIPFAERFHATGHGGIARITQTVAACRPAAAAGPPCSAPRRTDRARLRLPAGSRVRYARLYWGGDLRGGGPAAARDAGQVLLAGPRGRYEAVPAEGPLGRRSTGRTDDYQASADVTPLVRQGGAGPYAVARPAPGHRRARDAGRAGWALVVAYENPREPLRRAGPVGRLRTAGRAPAGVRGGTGRAAPAGAGARAGRGRRLPRNPPTSPHTLRPGRSHYSGRAPRFRRSAERHEEFSRSEFWSAGVRGSR